MVLVSTWILTKISIFEPCSRIFLFELKVSYVLSLLPYYVTLKFIYFFNVIRVYYER